MDKCELAELARERGTSDSCRQRPSLHSFPSSFSVGLHEVHEEGWRQSRNLERTYQNNTDLERTGGSSSREGIKPQAPAQPLLSCEAKSLEQDREDPEHRRRAIVIEESMGGRKQHLSLKEGYQTVPSPES